MATPNPKTPNGSTAEAVLHYLIGTLLLTTVLAAGYGWYATQRVGALASAAFTHVRQQGMAAGRLHGQEAVIRREITEFENAPQAYDNPNLDPGEAAALRASAAAKLNHMKGQADELKAQAGAAAIAAEQEGERLADASRSVVLQAAIVLAIVVAGAMALAYRFRDWIRRANVAPMRTAVQLVRKVADGDLTVSAEGMDQLHTRKLAEALDVMTSKLRALTAGVQRSARTVADTSTQIAQGHLDLSQRTEEQASTLEETASSMEELTSTVAHNADNARQASQLAASASEVARRGGEAVSQVVSTMNDISASSRRIGDIIGVIDGIAFQTNILALNAAVEAARAGEQGRGFAVVASEVRGLAKRSAAAAKEIKGLIGDSVQKVDAGSRQVDAAGRTMQEVVDSVRQVTALIAEIAAASQEQSAGIGQVNTAVAQMEQVVQQNASLVEEATAATESLKEQADLLLDAISRFKIGDEEEEEFDEYEEDGDEPVALRPVERVAAPATPAPIRVRPSPQKLPPAYAAFARRVRNEPPTDSRWQEL
ncbi:methyl-accepting chemotaxis protein [Ramlibacter humi]|uniref:Methyl-accepting chemotaxis protein n=1 Tax=Ramlibacter humi TaxID=2530451 RepID=A0A4Z0BBZ5_9BURK|nr:methyl-accepting chemotaxis protein [Ramlibacter humi]TFY96190.1 methyl-accepting chemotaxis protein [Ramlibacter humi]